MILPKLDKNFKPAIIELRKFNKDVLDSKNYNELIIAVERNNGYVYRKTLKILKMVLTMKETFLLLKELSNLFYGLLVDIKFILLVLNTSMNKLRAFINQMD